MHAEQTAKVLHIDRDVAKIFILEDGHQIGPLTRSVCQREFEEGRFSARDLAWHEGMSDWTPLGQVLGYPAAPDIAQPPPAPAAFQPAATPEILPPQAAPRVASPAPSQAIGNSLVVTQNMRGFIAANDFRVPREKGALRFSLVSLMAGWFVLEFTTFGPFVPVTALIIPALIGAFISIVYKQSSLKGSGVRVTERQMGDIHQSLVEAGHNLCITPPEVYLVQSHELNAYALGMFGKDAVILNSETVDTMDHKELQFIIGHEFAHIKCGHIFWKILGTQNPVFRFWVLRYILPFFMKWWSRQAEYTADRGGLLACRDVNAAVTALAKLTVGKELFKRLDINELVGQMSLTESDYMSKVSGSMSTHPDVAERIQKLVEYSRSGEYQALTAATPAALPA